MKRLFNFGKSYDGNGIFIMETFGLTKLESNVSPERTIEYKVYISFDELKEIYNAYNKKNENKN